MYVTVYLTIPYEKSIKIVVLGLAANSKKTIFHTCLKGIQLISAKNSQNYRYPYTKPSSLSIA